MMSRTAASARVLGLTQRLLAYETADKDFSEPKILAAARVSEKVRGPLSTLAGATAYHALLARALTLAKREAHGLSAVRIKPDGSLDGVNELLNDKDGEAGPVLIAHLLGLLVNFIGESLTLRLLQDVWPDLPLDDANSGGAKSK